MGTQEWLLLGIVLVVPLVVAIAVTLWTLEQAIKRNRKNRPDRVARRVSEPVTDTVAAPASGSTSHATRDHDDRPPGAPERENMPATPDDPGSPADSVSTGVGISSGDGGSSSDGGSSGDGGSSND
jgi:hypothetical protein